jgi:MFS family permease
MTNTTTAPTRVGAFPGILLLLGSCMSVLAAVLLTPVLPIMQEVYKASPVPAALILSAPALFVAIFSPFAGQIVDRLGRRKLLIVAMFAYAVIGTAPAWLPQHFIESAIFPLLLLRLLVGLCEAAIMTCCTTLIGDYYDGDRRNRYLGLQTVFTTISAIVFIAAGGGIVGTDASRWRLPFWVYALALLIVIPMIFVVKEPARAPRPANAEKVRIPWNRLWLPIIVTIFGGLAFFVILAESSLVYSGIGIKNTQTIGLISAGTGIATAIGSLLFARIAHLTAKVLLPIAFGALGVGLIVVWISAPHQATAAVIAGAAIASFGSGLLLPTLLVWAVGRLGYAERGRSTGLWQSAFFLGQFISPIVVQATQGGIGGTAVASLPIAMGIVGVVSIVLAALLGLFVRRTPMTISTAEAETAVSGEVPALQS